MEVNKEEYELNYPRDNSFNDGTNAKELIKEHFGSVKEHYSKNGRIGWTSYGVLHFVAFIFAVYLAFKCNPNISILSVIVAIFCPWIYIINILVTRKGICSDMSPNNPMGVELV